MSKPKPKSFTLGDHTFVPLGPGEMDPKIKWILDGHDQPPKPRQIKGALPPAYFDGMVRESTPKSPAAKALHEGKFCGHGEPVMSIFDFVIDGVELFEVSAMFLEEDEDPSQMNGVVVALRKPGEKTWIPIYRREWEEAGQGLIGVKRKPISDKERRSLEENAGQLQSCRVSIGFEYPSDTDSRDCVSWLTIDVAESGKKKPLCIVNAEMM